MGLKKSDRRKRTPVTKEARPVLAPAATPRRVPIVSNKSVNRNVKKITKNCPRTAKENFPVVEEITIPLKSKAKRYGFDGRENGLKFSGIVVTPKGIPIIVVMMIPIRMAMEKSVRFRKNSFLHLQVMYVH